MVPVTRPFWSVERSLEVRPVRYVVPLFVRLVVEAPPFKKVVPVKVEEACEMMPRLKVWRADQVYADAGLNGVPAVMHTPPWAKQPVVRLKPPAKVEVAVDVPMKYGAAMRVAYRPPAKVVVPALEKAWSPEKVLLSPRSVVEETMMLLPLVKLTLLMEPRTPVM